MTRPLLAALLLLAAGCKGEMAAPVDNSQVPPVNLGDVPGHEGMAQDSTHKESPRLVPAEAYMRTYLQLFGGLSALQVQQLFAGQANNGLFDNWNAYLGALGLPKYVTDLPRQGDTNALMIATFERLGVALCDKAVEKDLKGSSRPAIEKRLIFAFDPPKDPIDAGAFGARFDVLHRTFLGYPASLAPTDRTNRFFKLYQDASAIHTKDPKMSKFTPSEAGWAAVCYGLIRHPEFHLY